MDSQEDLKKRRQSMAETFNQPVISEETVKKVKGFFGSSDEKPDPVRDAYKKKLQSFGQ